MEFLDIYDENGNKTGRTRQRGEPLAAGECLLVVHMWLGDGQGRYLLQRRQLSKKLSPGCWSCAASGFAVSGEESVDAVLRETREELGVHLDLARLHLLRKSVAPPYIYHIWYATHYVPIAKIKLQPEEVMAAQWATVAQMEELAGAGQFVWGSYYGEVLRLIAEGAQGV